MDAFLGLLGLYVNFRNPEFLENINFEKNGGYTEKKWFESKECLFRFFQLSLELKKNVYSI